MEGIRFAGYNERRCIAREELGVYGSIVSVGTYSGPATGPFRQIITQALQKTILEHPALGTVVKKPQSTRPQVARVLTLELDKHLKFFQDHSAIEATEDILRYALNDRLPNIAIKPQWWVYVVPLPSTASHICFHLAFSCSHILADGKSLNVFHESVLRNLAAVETGLPSAELHRTPTSEEGLLPALDQAGTFLISWSFLLRSLFNEYLPNSLARLLGANTDDKKEIWHGAPAKPSLPEPGTLLSTSLCALSIHPEVLKRVLLVCKRYSAKLTGLINYCTARALAEALQKRGQPWNKFSVSSPLDMRRPLKQGDGQIVNYVSAMEEVLDVEPPFDLILREKDWAIITKTTEKLAKASSTLSDQPVALLGYLSDFPGWVKKKATTPAEESFEVSNIGIIDGSPDSGSGHWKIEEVAFAGSADGTGGPFNVTVASVKGGSLSVIMTWWPGMLGVEDEDAFAREICSGIEHQLRSLSGQS